MTDRSDDKRASGVDALRGALAIEPNALTADARAPAVSIGAHRRVADTLAYSDTSTNGLGPILRAGPEPNRVGEVVAHRYELGSRLGAGGFGSVYRANDTLTGRSVALKILRPRSGGEEEVFRRETGLLRLLHLPGVVRLIDDGVHDGRPFIVTEIVDGEPFPGAPPADWADIEEMIVGLLEALDRVHTHGVIHRDLKPSNVLVGRDGRPTILDFGVSRSRDPGDPDGLGDTVGTPFYMAPEQFAGRPATARSDLYSLGVMLYEALSGRPPFEARTSSDLVAAKYRPLAPLRPSVPVPRAVVEVVIAMTSPTVAERPGSAAEVIAALGTGTTTPERVGPLRLDRGPFTARALEQLFHGPEIGFHLPSDAAAVLHARSEGQPERVSIELAAWVRAGLCFWEGGRVRITRDAIDRLDAGLDVVRSNYPPGHPGARPASDSSETPRLPRGRAVDHVDQLVEASRRARDAGHASRARAIAESALQLARGSGDVARKEAAARELVLANVTASTGESVDLALWELGRLPQTRLVKGLTELMRVRHLAQRGDSIQRAVPVARQVPEFEDLELERWRRIYIYQVNMRASEQAHDSAASELVAWARERGGEPLATEMLAFTGFAEYRRGNFALAAEQYLRAAQSAPATTRVNAISNAAMALIECRRFVEAREWLDVGIREARDSRRVAQELRMLGMCASIRYRLGEPEHDDPELLDAMRAQNEPIDLGPLVLCRAATAWRNRDMRTARVLALEAASCFGGLVFAPAVTLCRALATAAGDFVDREQVDALMHAAKDGPPGLIVQAAALFSSAGFGGFEGLPAWDPPGADLRAEVLSPDEARELLRV